MNGLTWVDSFGSGNLIKNDLLYTIHDKPTLSFAFDDLYWEPLTKNVKKVVNGQDIPLTDAEIKECDDYVTAQNPQRYLPSIDAAGAYIGNMLEGTAEHVPTAPPNKDWWRWDRDRRCWVYVMAVDAGGNYLGNVKPGTYEAEVPNPPPHDYETWDFTAKAWTDTRPLPVYQHAACDAIDHVADMQCGQHITLGLSQESRYRQKAEEAKAYKAGGYVNLATFSYINEEAAATQGASETLDQAGKRVADTILTMADSWTAMGAKIEAQRVAGKQKVMAATDRSGVDTALQGAREAIGKIG